MFMLGERDFVHFQGGVECVLRGTANEGHDGWRGCHGEGANAGGLGDGAVADIGVGVFAAEAREVKAVGDLRFGLEPVVAQPADTDAEVGAVAGHGGDDGAALDAVRGVGHRLAGRHHRVEDPQGVFADELQDLCLLGAVLGYSGHQGRQLLQEEQGAGLVAIVALVPHVERLGQEGPEVDALASVDALSQDGRHHVVHPAQTVDHLLAIGAVTQHLAVAFVQV